MCGIAGFISGKHFPGLKESLPRAVESMSHRGPDAWGIYFDREAGLGLGHRRLSILDLSEAGRQPMSACGDRFHITYNGEIYNYKSIRKTLIKEGLTFRTETDTEVLLKAWERWGADCIERFVGMFAFALWDKSIRRLFLVRDRLGIKPLYYYADPDMFLFSSELKGLMAFGLFPGEIRPEALPLFLHYQYIPAPKTVFKKTKKLLPGEMLIFDAHGIRTKKYWSLPTKGQWPDSSGKDYEEESLAKLEELLIQSVSDRLVSDVPLGALLSGGIDSSIVAAVMQKVSPTPAKTFSIGFREPEYNEAPWASKVAKRLGTDHTELYVTPGEALEVIPSLPEIYDEPFGDLSAIPTFLVSKLTRQSVTVALSGDGGDEQFCGYVRYWSTRAAFDLFKKIPGPAKEALGRLLQSIPPAWMERCYLPVRSSLPQRFRVTNFREKWQKLVSLMGHSRARELYRMTICLWPREDILALTGMNVPEGTYEKSFDETGSLPLLSRLMRADQCTYLPDAMLTKVDRASMAASLEVRVPLLDHRIVEFTGALSPELKYKDGAGKYLLKKLLGKYLPQELYDRPKMGFGVPMEKWFRGEMKELLLDYLSPGRLKKEGLLDHNLVDKTVKEHLSGNVNRQYRLWPVLMWEMWRERWNK